MSTADPSDGAADPGPPPLPPQDTRGAPEAPPTIRRRWFWLVLVLLALSVMLNLFIAGVIAGRAGGVSGLGLAGLPQEIRAVVREEVAADRPALFRSVRALRAARRELRAALTADPYDPARAETAFEDLRQSTLRMQTVMHGAYLRAAARLPAEVRAKLPERRQFMQRLQRRLERM